MYQAGGIDKLISQKADAFRKNPEALSQQAQISGDLIAAIADQKLKKEKMEAQRQIALMAQQNPNTIVAQNEQALAAMSKDDIVKQTTGILGERQKAAQQKQQAMGIPPQQPQGQPQGQRPPMPQGAPPQGIAGQPRPNMQGMAGGGIIGYKKGEEVKNPAEEDLPSGLEKLTGEVVDWAMDNPMQAVSAGLMFLPGVGWAGSAAIKAAGLALKAGNVLYKGAKAANYGTKLVQAAKKVPGGLGNLASKAVTRPSSVNKIISKDKTTRPIGREYSPGRATATGAALYGGASALGAFDQEEEAPAAKEMSDARTPPGAGVLTKEEGDKKYPLQPSTPDSQGGLDSIVGLGEPKPLTPPAATPATVPPGGGVLTPAALKAREAAPAGAGAGAGAGGLDSIEIGTPPKFPQTKVSDAVDPKVKEMMDAKLAADPTTARDAEQKRLNEFYRREKYDKANVDVNAEIEALRKSQTSPENEREQQRRAMILGTIKGGRLGGGLEAVQNTRDNQAKSRMDRLEKKRANVLETQKADFEIAKQIGEGALGMYTAVAESQNEAMKLSIALTEADLTAGQTAFTNWYNRQEANIQFKLKDRELTLTDELNTLIKNSQATQNSRDIELKILKGRADIVKIYKDSQFNTISPIETKISKGEELTPTENTALRNYEIGLQAAQAPYNAMLDDLFKGVVKENPNATATATAASAVDPSAKAEDRAASFLAQ
jgi:hypothetical protein